MASRSAVRSLVLAVVALSAWVPTAARVSQPAGLVRCPDYSFELPASRSHDGGKLVPVVSVGAIGLTGCHYPGLRARGSLRVAVPVGRDLTAYLDRIMELLARLRPLPRDAIFACPADFGDHDLLLFRYPSGVVHQVQVDLSGCGFVFNGQRAYWSSNALRRLLAEHLEADTVPLTGGTDHVR